MAMLGMDGSRETVGRYRSALRCHALDMEAQFFTWLLVVVVVVVVVVVSCYSSGRDEHRTFGNATGDKVLETGIQDPAASPSALGYRWTDNVRLQ